MFKILKIDSIFYLVQIFFWECIYISVYYGRRTVQCTLDKAFMFICIGKEQRLQVWSAIIELNNVPLLDFVYTRHYDWIWAVQ